MVVSCFSLRPVSRYIRRLIQPRNTAINQSEFIAREKSNFYWFSSSDGYFFVSCDFFNCNSGCQHVFVETTIFFCRLNYWYTSNVDTSASRLYVLSCQLSYQPKYNLHMGDCITHVVGMWKYDRTKFTKTYFSLEQVRLAFRRWCRLLSVQIMFFCFFKSFLEVSSKQTSNTFRDWILILSLTQLYHGQQNVFTFLHWFVVAKVSFFLLLINPVVVQIAFNQNCIQVAIDTNTDTARYVFCNYYWLLINSLLLGLPCLFDSRTDFRARLTSTTASHQLTTSVFVFNRNTFGEKKRARVSKKRYLWVGSDVMLMSGWMSGCKVDVKVNNGDFSRDILRDATESNVRLFISHQVVSFNS